MSTNNEIACRWLNIFIKSDQPSIEIQLFVCGTEDPPQGDESDYPYMLNIFIMSDKPSMVIQLLLSVVEDSPQCDESDWPSRVIYLFFFNWTDYYV